MVVLKLVSTILFLENGKNGVYLWYLHTTKYKNSTSEIKSGTYIIIKWIQLCKIKLLERSYFQRKKNKFFLFAHSIAPFVEIREKDSFFGIFTTFIFHSKQDGLAKRNAVEVKN